MRHSPFSVNRFEYEPRHVYFVQTEAFAQLQARKPVYLIGPRGTGKTTLLQALNWNERNSNPSLRAQLDDHDEAFIGVYIKIPEIELGSVERWLAGLSRLDAGKVIAFYLDLLWIQQACQAIAQLVDGGAIELSAESEQNCIATLVEDFHRTFSTLPKNPRTLLELRVAASALARELVRSARSGVAPADYWSRHDAIEQPGTFGRGVGARLTQMLGAPSETQEDGWYFKVCLDEGECLSDLQQRVLNSMVRLSRWPVFFVAAFVRMPKDVSSTLIDGLTLQSADCELVDLTEFLTARRFRELAEGVATARVQQHEGSGLEVKVSTLLGTFGINTLLQKILGDSVAPLAKELLRTAAELKAEPFFEGQDIEQAPDEDEWAEVEAETAAPPIYQVYLIDHMHLTLPRPEQPAWVRRRQSSAELRKRMVAAYLSICTDLRTDVRYASANMVMGLCDLCIRDFLDFMHGIHLATRLSVKEFVTKQVAWERQHDALVTVSKAKSSSTRSRGVRAPREAESVVRGLAKITHLLQTQSQNGEHLRSSERGIFVLPAERFELPTDPTAQVIRDACEAGFLRMMKSEGDVISFRVHASLAPAFEFSYRGAYYPAPVSWADIDLLRRSESEGDLESVAVRIARRLAGEQNLSLFGTE